MAASDKFILIQPVDNALGDEGMVVADLQEFSHKIANELIEKVRSGKTDYDYGVHSEELGITTGRVKGDPAQNQLIECIKKKKQLKIWLGDRAYDQTTQMHDVIFAYTVVEELENGADDEDETIEATLKIKIESVAMKLPKLPESILNPASANVTVEAEKPGEYTGPLETRTKTSTGA